MKVWRVYVGEGVIVGIKGDDMLYTIVFVYILFYEYSLCIFLSTSLYLLGVDQSSEGCNVSQDTTSILNTRNFITHINI